VLMVRLLIYGNVRFDDSLSNTDLILELPLRYDGGRSPTGVPPRARLHRYRLSNERKQPPAPRILFAPPLSSRRDLVTQLADAHVSYELPECSVTFASALD
jgi:hypothetical protein